MDSVNSFIKLVDKFSVTSPSTIGSLFYDKVRLEYCTPNFWYLLIKVSSKFLAAILKDLAGTYRSELKTDNCILIIRKKKNTHHFRCCLPLLCASVSHQLIQNCPTHQHLKIFNQNYGQARDQRRFLFGVSQIEI